MTNKELQIRRICMWSMQKIADTTQGKVTTPTTSTAGGLRNVSRSSAASSIRTPTVSSATAAAARYSPTALPAGKALASKAPVVGQAVNGTTHGKDAVQSFYNGNIADGVASTGAALAQLTPGTSKIYDTASSFGKTLNTGMQSYLNRSDVINSDRGFLSRMGGAISYGLRPDVFAKNKVNGN